MDRRRHAATALALITLAGRCAWGDMLSEGVWSKRWREVSRPLFSLSISNCGDMALRLQNRMALGFGTPYFNMQGQGRRTTHHDIYSNHGPWQHVTGSVSPGVYGETAVVEGTIGNMAVKAEALFQGNTVRYRWTATGLDKGAAISNLSILGGFFRHLADAPAVFALADGAKIEGKLAANADGLTGVKQVSLDLGPVRLDLAFECAESRWTYTKEGTTQVPCHFSLVPQGNTTRPSLQPGDTIHYEITATVTPIYREKKIITDVWPDEPTMRDLWRAESLLLPVREQELGRDVYRESFDPAGPKRGNFTYFGPGVEALKTTPDATMAFTATKDKVTLGWGNYQGKQPSAERRHLWFWYNTIRVRVRQSEARKTSWTLRLWSDGQRMGGPRVTASFIEDLEGTAWQTLTFKTWDGAYRSVAALAADGMELTIGGAKGATFEVGKLTVSRRVYEGYCRREITLPPGRVWRAMANVGINAHLYINGRKIPVGHAMFRRPDPDRLAQAKVYRGGHPGTVPVDITRYLKPGANCLGLRARLVEDCALVMLQGAAVMESGEVVRFQSDRTWRYSREAPEGWCSPGFDAGAWAQVETADWDRPTKVGYYPHIDYLVLGYLISPAGSWVGPDIPAYEGRLAVEHPSRGRLYFDGTQPVAVQVRVPAGLATRRPVLLWRALRYEPDGEAEAAKGTVSTFETRSGSLVYTAVVGRVDRGVYSLATELRAADGAVIEKRYREPFIVFKRFDMPAVAGDEITEGLDLELEDTIDFTDPTDPHPWVETRGFVKTEVTQPVTQPKIVRKGKLVYRETQALVRGQSRGNPMFSYKFTFKHPNAWYLMVLDYPDDAERWIGVSCSTTVPGVWTNSRGGASVLTGNKYPLSHTMRPLRWLYRSGPGTFTIDVVPVKLGCTAAAARLRIYHVRNPELPAVRLSAGRGRRTGVYTERTTLGAGFGKTFGRIVDQKGMPVIRDQAGYAPMPERLGYLHKAVDACEAYTRYLRFTGQNLHAMGCHQYNGGNTPFMPADGIAAHRVTRDLRDMLVNVLEVNGIDVIGVISYSDTQYFGEENYHNAGQIAAGQPTMLMMTGEGQPPVSRSGLRGYGTGWNWQHPRVWGHMQDVAQAVAEKFKHNKNFLGVNWTVYLTGEWMPGYAGFRYKDALDCSYDDVTVARFEKDTGLRVPGAATDPGRFKKRYDFLTAKDMRDRWVQWRCQRMHDFFVAMRDNVRQVRPDLDTFVALYIDVPHLVKWTEMNDRTGISLETYLREWGWDFGLYAHEPGLRLARWAHAILHGQSARQAERYSIGWTQLVGDEFVRLHSAAGCRDAVIMHQWMEVNYAPPGVTYDRSKRTGAWADKPTWPLPFNRGRFLFQPCGDNAREMFAQMLATTDPRVLMYGFMDVNMMVGGEQELREFNRVFTALPDAAFEPALDTTLDTNLVVREARLSDGLAFYVVNPGFWPVKGHVTLKAASRVRNLLDGSAAKVTQRGGQSVVALELKPYSVAAFEAQGRDAKLTAWRNEPIPAAELAHALGIADLAKTLLDGDARIVLTDEQAAYMERQTAAARECLGRGLAAKAWRILTHWRYWWILRQRLEPASHPDDERYAAQRSVVQGLMRKREKAAKKNR